MALTKFAFLLAGAAAATALYRMSQRPSLDTSASGDSGERGADEFSPLDAAPLNQGQRLQDLQLVGTGIGGANAHNEDLLTPPRGDEQQSETIKPGLPDFARGA
jgi:hypothetical protein